MIAIIGAGLTGLSTACHLKDLPYTLFESENEVGGLCRSVEQNGFVFDYTGHLLHIKDPAVLQFVNTILPDAFMKITRRASVFTRDRNLPYPFQANLNGLPKKTVLKCITDLVLKKINNRKSQSLNFKDWVIETFGRGISEEFFIPYNEKLYRTPLEQMTRTWAGWSIPQPSLYTAIRGALGIKNVGMGYNASFYYPKNSGIHILSKAMANQIKNIRTNKELVSIDTLKKEIAFSDGTKQKYEYLVSTLPLPCLLNKIINLPDIFRDAAKKLKYVSVQNLNLGIDRKCANSHHWTYFPESRFPFYRVGCYSKISPALSPENTSSYYIEISSLPHRKKSEADLTEQTVHGLKACGLLKENDRIIEKKYLEIEHAYVIFDEFREKMLPPVFEYLNQNTIFSIGRYGSWTYSAMENAILEGRQTAEKILCRK